MKKIYSLFLMLLMFAAAKSQYVQKVTGINYYGYNGLNPSNITVFNNKLYFLGTDDLHYVDKLMFTDGSEAGVTVVKQIDTIKQYPTLRHLTATSNLLLFDNYHQLWVSDGSTAGTSKLKNIEVSPANYAVLNNKVYFAGDSSLYNDQLWQTDGTPGGTTLVKTINPSGAADINAMFSYGGNIYFRANDGTHQGQLWISDGTPGGTNMLKLINATGNAYVHNFAAYNGKVYFSADDGVSGYQLWVTDGTNGGTSKVTNINTTTVNGISPSLMTVFNARLFFCGMDTGSFYQLFSTDGTAPGTATVKTDYTPRNGTRGFNPSSMAVHNNQLYIAGYDSLTAFDQLWVSDGTTAGTARVSSNPLGLFPSRLFSFQSKLIFTGYDTVSQQTQLFASDGTAAGTVCPTPPDTWGQYPFYPWEAWVPFNNALYFKAAYAYFADYQLCRYSELPMGITKQTTENLAVYPNPANGFFNVVLPASTNNPSIEVYNSIGVLIYKQTVANGVNTIDLTSHAQGLYILKVIGNCQTIASQKIIKE